MVVTGVLAALAAAGVVGGALLLADGLRSSPLQDRPSDRPGRQEVAPWLRRRLLPALAAGVLVAVLTRWPSAAVGVGLVTWFRSELFGSRTERERLTARTEAIASWTEMLRDTMAGAHGLEEAVITTAAVAPAPIRAEVATLATRTRRQPLSQALGRFGDDLAHPVGDLVVAALTRAASGGVGDLSDLLGSLAAIAREEAGMRLRVEAARARLRTAVRVIAGCTVATAVTLVVLNRSYLDVYASALGQVVLAVVVAAWGLALWWLARMSEFVTPERFLAGSEEVTT
jgi:tight adherence protein B